MKTFGFEHDPVPRFDPVTHGIDASHCKSLRPKTEYRDRDTGRRLKYVRVGEWLSEDENGEWVPVKNPQHMEYVLSDEDSDVAYYLEYMVGRYGERVSMKSVMKLDEPMRSAVLGWSGLDRVERDVSDCVDMWISDEYGLVVTWQQMWMYGVDWVSPEGLEKAHARVRKMKDAGEWKDVHPNGVTMVFRTGAKS